VSLGTAVLVSLIAVQAGGSPPPNASAQAAKAITPLSVTVEKGAGGGAVVTEWATELRRALLARKDEFRLAKDGEKPEFVVRLDSVTLRPGAPSLLAFVCRRGAAERSFSYSFTEVKPEADKLARNLRSVADKLQGAGR
jgi:hypothetical protein